MADDLTTLKSSVADRATALGSYITALKADSARSDQGFKRALDVCEGYTRAFVTQLNESDWPQATTRQERQDLLEASLASFLERERWIDQRFARGAQRDVPRALKTIARREFRAHGLDGHEPVLTVGPPDSFETHQASLAKFLFADIHIRLNEELEPLRYGGIDLSIFAAPYIEGTRVLWYPIVLGHEIAHIRLDRGNGSRARDAMVESWLTDRGPEYGSAIEDTVRDLPDPDMARVALAQQVVSWTTELICDLNAARLFGPAGLSAIAEFLAILEFQPEEQTLDTHTHPPLWVRLKLLFEFLEQSGWHADSNLPAHAGVWQSRSQRPPDDLNPRTVFVANLLTMPSVAQQLIDLVRDWGDTYKGGSEAAIDHVTAELLDGVPGATHVRTADRVWPEVTVPDVVNAAWAARRALDDVEIGEHVENGGVLLECDLSAHEKRVKLDSLAAKAIDTLELARLWGARQGIIPPTTVDARQPIRPRPASMTEEGSGQAVTGGELGGVLSRRTIAWLLQQGRDNGAGRRMVVTPLSHDSVQDAAIDLRLGPDFIVFRHSAITAFNPLAEDDQDPRTMQERVHKGWGERFILHPQELVLASTLEYIVLPDNVAAQVLTRSSYGRLGLLTATAVQVQPGSRGCITLELVNQGETPIELSPAARVAQLMLWNVTDPCEVERGKYWFPVGPEFSKVGEDPDRGPLHTLATAAKEPAAAPRPHVRARFEGDRGAAEQFYRLARSLGAEEALGRPDAMRLGPEIAGIVVGVLLSIKILAVTVQRWLQGTAHGVVIVETEDDVVVRVDRQLPRGTVVVRDRNGLTVKQLEMPPDDIDDVAQAFRKLLP